LERLEAIRESIKQEAFPKKFILTRGFLPPLLKGLQHNVVGVVRLRLVQTALALEQYRLANGRMPDSLAGLCPNFLSKVPTDPFGNEEVLYRKQSPGYVIYSVGPDRHDDGGTKQLLLDAKREYPNSDITFLVAR
jgi:hypothetical protein